MKQNRKLVMALIILLIILISMISFVGIFVQNKNKMKSIVNPYAFTIDLEGARRVELQVDDTVNTIYYDKDGNKVDEEAKDGTKEEVPANATENLTAENYVATKKIIAKRLKAIGVDNYLIRQDEKNGKTIVELPEDSNTNMVISFLYTPGDFSIENEEGEVLLDKSNLKEVKVGYGATSVGTNVYLQLVFHEDAYEKVREMSTTYIGSTDSDDSSNTKQVTFKIDDSTLTTTNFGDEITNGIISLTIGSASTNAEELTEYIKEASNLAILLNNDTLPVVYKIAQNKYIQSSVTDETFATVGLIIATIIIIALIVLIVKYKKNGLLASLSYIGYMAILLITLRYTGIILSVEGIFAICINFVFNYILTGYLLKRLKDEAGDSTGVKKAVHQSIIKMLLIAIPVAILGTVLCFANWQALYSFGGTIFWGILLLFIYNLAVTRTLLIAGVKKE